MYSLSDICQDELVREDKLDGAYSTHGGYCECTQNLRKSETYTHRPRFEYNIKMAVIDLWCDSMS